MCAARVTLPAHRKLVWPRYEEGEKCGQAPTTGTSWLPGVDGTSTRPGWVTVSRPERGTPRRSTRAVLHTPAPKAAPPHSGRRVMHFRHRDLEEFYLEFESRLSHKLLDCAGMDGRPIQ